eukprot:TRINITY_DN63516_c0_g1_i1.p1 TRINITY_DN63516_c0_g1~~TRINITY_DN63516_c0_g1_i1.p1  ORF type:complete len:629 (-),score=89.44 TRINITY_DN63516_c0_g1_i1:112-1998(-)
MDKLQIYVSERVEILNSDIQAGQVPSEEKLHHFVRETVLQLQVLSSSAAEHVRRKVSSPWSPYWTFVGNAPGSDPITAPLLLNVLKRIEDGLSAPRVERQFLKLNGETVACAPGLSKVADACKHIAAETNCMPTQVRLVNESGDVLNYFGDLPDEGAVYIRILTPPEGSWGTLVHDASVPLKLKSLRRALLDSWPRSLAQIENCSWGIDDDALLELRTIVTSMVGSWADFAVRWWFREVHEDVQANLVNSLVKAVEKWQLQVFAMEVDFAELRERISSMPISEAVEVASAKILSCLPEFHRYEFEYWYYLYNEVVQWFAESAGMDPDRVCSVLQNAIFTGFQSWECRADASAYLAENVALSLQETFQKIDSTAAWLEIRPSLRTAATAMTQRVEKEDAHLRYINTVDARRGLRRAARMKAALALCREDAASCKPLTFEMMSAWHEVAFGPIDFPGQMYDSEDRYRVRDAYAKEGRERYPSEDSYKQLFFELLAAANPGCGPDGTKVPERTEDVCLRAARAYLDCLFFHPFGDGNSRLARLLLDFILARDGLCLVDALSIFAMPRRADDEPGGSDFAKLVVDAVAARDSNVDSAIQSWSTKNPKDRFTSRRDGDGGPWISPMLDELQRA